MKKYVVILCALSVCLSCLVHATTFSAVDIVKPITVDQQLTRLCSEATILDRYATIDKSLSGVNLYVDTMRQINETIVEQAIEDVAVTITFNRFMSFDDLSAFLEQYGLDVHKIQLSARSSSNERITFFSKLSKVLKETEALILGQCAEEAFTMKGIVAVYAFMSAETLCDLTTDSSVLVADITGDTVFRQQFCLSENESERASQTIEPSQSEFAHSLAWTAETLGLYD